MITQVKIMAEHMFTLKNEQDWMDKVPDILPVKERGNEQWLWVDKDGFVFEQGADFAAAERISAYPCNVYKAINIFSKEKMKFEVVETLPNNEEDRILKLNSGKVIKISTKDIILFDKLIYNFNTAEKIQLFQMSIEAMEEYIASKKNTLLEKLIKLTKTTFYDRSEGNKIDFTDGDICKAYLNLDEVINMAQVRKNLKKGKYSYKQQQSLLESFENRNEMYTNE